MPKGELVKDKLEHSCNLQQIGAWAANRGIRVDRNGTCGTKRSFRHVSRSQTGVEQGVDCQAAHRAAAAQAKPQT